MKYADDTTLITGNIEDLHYSVDPVNEESKKTWEFNYPMLMLI